MEFSTKQAERAKHLLELYGYNTEEILKSATSSINQMELTELKLEKSFSEKRISLEEYVSGYSFLEVEVISKGIDGKYQDTLRNREMNRVGFYYNEVHPSLSVDELIAKSDVNSIEKSRELPEGTIRDYSGHKVIKRGGKWIPHSDGSKKKITFSGTDNATSKYKKVSEAANKFVLDNYKKEVTRIEGAIEQLKKLPSDYSHMGKNKEESIKQAQGMLNEAKAKHTKELNSQRDPVTSVGGLKYKSKEELGEMTNLEISKYSNELRGQRSSASGSAKENIQKQIDLADSMREGFGKPKKEEDSKENPFGGNGNAGLSKDWKEGKEENNTEYKILNAVVNNDFKAFQAATENKTIAINRYYSLLTNKKSSDTNAANVNKETFAALKNKLKTKPKMSIVKSGALKVLGIGK